MLSLHNVFRTSSGLLSIQDKHKSVYIVCFVFVCFSLVGFMCWVPLPENQLFFVDEAIFCSIRFSLSIQIWLQIIFYFMFYLFRVPIKGIFPLCYINGNLLLSVHAICHVAICFDNVLHKCVTSVYTYRKMPMHVDLSQRNYYTYI